MKDHTENHANVGAPNNCALASLILSICFVIIGPLGSIPGIICGRIALKKYRDLGISEGPGMAKAGVIIGWIGLVAFLISLLIGWIAMRRIDQIYETIRAVPAS
mgnify:CR=1 FL=1